MSQINLLPDSLRRKKKKIAEPKKGTGSITFADRLKFLPLWVKKCYIIFFLSLLIIESILVLNIKRKETRLASFKGKGYQISSVAGEIEDLAKKRQDLTEGLKSLETISQREFYWSRQLNIISDAIPDGVWIRRLLLEKRNISKGIKEEYRMNVLIEGSVFSNEQQLIDLATEFLNNLRLDSYFAKNFTDLKMGTMTKTKISEFDILYFSINN